MQGVRQVYRATSALRLLSFLSVTRACKLATVAAGPLRRCKSCPCMARAHLVYRVHGVRLVYRTTHALRLVSVLSVTLACTLVTIPVRRLRECKSCPRVAAMHRVCRAIPALCRVSVLSVALPRPLSLGCDRMRGVHVCMRGSHVSTAQHLRSGSSLSSLSLLHEPSQ